MILVSPFSTKVKIPCKSSLRHRLQWISTLKCITILSCARLHLSTSLYYILPHLQTFKHSITHTHQQYVTGPVARRMQASAYIARRTFPHQNVEPSQQDSRWPGCQRQVLEAASSRYVEPDLSYIPLEREPLHKESPNHPS